MELDLVEKEYAEIELELQARKVESITSTTSEVDALDVYMRSICSGAMDASTRMIKKRRITELKTEKSPTKTTCDRDPCNLPKAAL